MRASERVEVISEGVEAFVSEARTHQNTSTAVGVVLLSVATLQGVFSEPSIWTLPWTALFGFFAGIWLICRHILCIREERLIVIKGFGVQFESSTAFSIQKRFHPISSIVSVFVHEEVGAFSVSTCLAFVSGTEEGLIFPFFETKASVALVVEAYRACDRLICEDGGGGGGCGRGTRDA